MKQLKYFLFFFYLMTVGIFFGRSVSAATTQSVRLDHQTVQKGYTITDSENTWKVGVPPSYASGAVVITANFYKSVDIVHQDFYPVSKVFTIDTETSATLLQPLNVIFDYDPVSYHDLVVKKRNDSTQKWENVEAYINTYNHTVTVQNSAAHADYAVFELIPAPKRTALDVETLAKGFTLTSENNELNLGVRPNSFDRPVRGVIKSVALDSVRRRSDMISNVYSFDFLPVDGKGGHATVQEPIMFMLDYKVTSDFHKVLKYWDNNVHDWVALPSQRVVDENKVRGVIHLPYAEVAVFEDTAHMAIGKASWFRTRNSNTMVVANNDYPMGSEILVTNLANNKQVRARVISTGPFIPGRIVDLSFEAFAQIADPYGDGVIHVLIQPLL